MVKKRSRSYSGKIHMNHAKGNFYDVIYSANRLSFLLLFIHSSDARKTKKMRKRTKKSSSWIVNTSLFKCNIGDELEKKTRISLKTYFWVCTICMVLIFLLQDRRISQKLVYSKSFDREVLFISFLEDASISTP